MRYLAVLALFVVWVFWAIETQAATGGQTTLYLHRENAAASTTYNVLTLSPPSPSTLTTSADITSITTPFAPCEAVVMTGNLINSIVVDDDSVQPAGDYCLATFFSLPVGQTIAVETIDAAALSGEMYGSNTVGDNANTNFIFRVYKYDGASFTQLGTLTFGDIAGGVTNAKVAASATPSANVTLNPGDRVAVVLSLNLISQDASGGADNTKVQFGSNVTPSFLRLNYTALTPSKPDLTGAKDDDFALAATSSCSNAGITYNSKWTCITPAGAVLGDFDANASSSQWLILRDKEDGTLGTNFGASPENTYLYQSVDTNLDGEGDVTTVLNSTVNGENGTSPFFQAGLLLWTSNTDYLILQASFDGTNRGAMINQSGTVSSSTALSEYNRLWLRWSKTGSSYVAKYSTDGAVWTDLGSPIAHGVTFTRAGLTAYAAAINTEYAGAFEWFDYGLSPKFNQSAFRWFSNQDATTTGMALALQDTKASTTAAGEAFRLRLLIHTSGELSPSEESFKLQFIGRGTGSCVNPSGGTPGTWSDVGTTTLISFKDNLSVLDGVLLAASTSDPTHGADTVLTQSYEELNNFTFIATTSPGADAKWDFSLFDNGASGGASYCFKAVTATGTPLDTYSSYPEIAMFSAATLSGSGDQVFEFGQGPAAISTITITALGPGITAVNDLRIAIATSTINMRWDTSDTAATFGGTASGKVANPVSYEGDGSVLVVGVNTDFVTNDTLTVAALAFANFNAVTASTSPLVLFLGGPTDSGADATTDRVIAIKGKLALGESNAGQEQNKLNVPETSVLNAELFAFRLTPAGESVSVAQLVIDLSGLKGYKCSDLTNLNLYVDFNNNGNVETGETQVGGTPACMVDGVLGTGSFSFTGAFATSTARNYILRSDVASNNPGDSITLSLASANLTASGAASLQPITSSGAVTSASHFRESQGGGGGGTGGGSPAAETPSTGGTGLGGGAPPPPPEPPTGGGGQGGGGETLGPLQRVYANIFSLFRGIFPLLKFYWR